MVELTVGHVAGIIALAIFIARVWVPTQLTFILSGLLRDKETAATWTVAARSLQNSYWPDMLRTDPSHVYGVKRSVQFSTTLAFLVALLCAIAGVVTPLGLYEAFEPAGSKSLSFAYVKDSSPFGVSTPPRSPLPWSRTCSQGHGLGGQGPAPCPYSNTTIIYSWDGKTFTWEWPNGNNVTVSNTLRDIFSSGTRDNASTVSNFFDIEWRQYSYTNDIDKNNGDTLLVGGYRPVMSLILSEKLEAVEGLVVDALSGRGIGFRNHTLPVGLRHGGTWSEDLLFIEPESSCVNTNLSIEFTFSSNAHRTSVSPFLNFSLVDYGGFHALNTTYPYYDHDNAQNNPDLTARAYKAAYLNNAYTMAYLNVTPTSDPVTGKGAFAYIDSFPGKRFPLEYDSTVLDYNSLMLSNSFGEYLQLNGFSDENARYTNPFNISRDDFDSISTVCTGSTVVDLANSSNIYVSCGLMRGVARRLNPGPPALFESGSSWSTPIYACASTVRATIKTVSFLLNDTSRFANLFVTDIASKNYSKTSDIPLWGFEETGLAKDGIHPIWGLLSPEYENYPNVSTFRKPSLYLPGLSGTFGSTIESFRTSHGLDYVPGSDFPAATMNSVFELGSSAITGSVDYSGSENMALYLKWQKLSQSADGAAQIINLIWTDIAANAAVGTKGVLGNGNAGNPDDAVNVEVKQIQRKIKYHIPYAIPAILLAAILFTISVAALVAWLTGVSNRATLRRRLHQASAGRILVASIASTQDTWTLPSKKWSRQYGKVEIGMRDEQESTEEKDDPGQYVQTPPDDNGTLASPKTISHIEVR